VSLADDCYDAAVFDCEGVGRRRRGRAPERQEIEDTTLGAIYLPRIRRKRSSLHGWGVFALEDINKNKRIVTYDGEKISSKESADREDRYLRRGEIWCFRLNQRWVIDANVNGNVARFINHSCRPNCYSNVIDGTIWVIAGKSVTAGDELTYDYHTEGDKEIECHCRPGCTTRL